MSSSASATRSIFDIVKDFRERINRQAQSKRPSILHYDPIKQDLGEWCWPVYPDGERVRPKDLSTYRKTHNVYIPSCLCGVLDGRTIGRKEASLFLDQDDCYRVACGSNRCGYSVDIDRIYRSPASPVRKYGLRENELGESEPRTKAANPVAEEGFAGLYGGVPLAYRKPKNRPPTTFGLLMQLDDPSVPGLPDDVFSKMFTQCTACHWLMTTDAFPRHTCLLPPIERKVVVDLTLDDSDEDLE